MRCRDKRSSSKTRYLTSNSHDHRAHPGRYVIFCMTARLDADQAENSGSCRRIRSQSCSARDVAQEHGLAFRSATELQLTAATPCQRNAFLLRIHHIKRAGSAARKQSALASQDNSGSECLRADVAHEHLIMRARAHTTKLEENSRTRRACNWRSSSSARVFDRVE
jgi:hypothetical protein